MDCDNLVAHNYYLKYIFVLLFLINIFIVFCLHYVFVLLNGLYLLVFISNSNIQFCH